MNDKYLILDATCGGRMMWFNKHHPNAVYMDIRTESKGCIPQQTNFEVSPDVEGDFTDMDFPDESFSLVVFDPPHAQISKNSVIGKKYGSLEKEWEPAIIGGIQECWRVLAPNGVLIFKWAEAVVPIGEVLRRLPSDIQPLFGHTTAKSGKTIWVTFMKIAGGFK